MPASVKKMPESRGEALAEIERLEKVLSLGEASRKALSSSVAQKETEIEEMRKRLDPTAITITHTDTLAMAHVILMGER